MRWQIATALCSVVLGFMASIGEHLIDHEARVAAAEPVPVPDTAVTEATGDPGPEAS
jgi:hypothetical protein